MERDRDSTVFQRLTQLQDVPGVYTTYIWRNVTVTFWFGPIDMEGCAELERGCRKIAAEHPEGVTAVNVMIPGGGSMPSAAARAELARIMREYNQSAAAIPIILAGDGFWASAVRGMIASLAMLRPRRLQLQIFGTAAAAVEWLLPLHAAATGVQLDAAELRLVLQEAERAAASTRAAAA